MAITEWSISGRSIRVSDRKKSAAQRALQQKEAQDQS
jgi:hypothetical protein